MNTIRKRIVAALLLLTMITSAAACAEKADDTSEGDVSDTAAVEEETEEETDPRKLIFDDVPADTNFDGFTFHMYSRNRDDFKNDLNLESDGESGEVVEDAIYKRNMNVEERLGINLEASYWETPAAQAQKVIAADDRSIGVVLDNALNTGNSIPSGYFMAWDDLPYINLQKPWYTKNVVDSMSINNHTYMMAGEFNLSLLRFTYCMYYNKKVAEDLSVNDIYDRVVGKSWTYDSLYNTVLNAYSDLNGDGQRDDKDRYGLTTDFYGASTNYQYAFGVKLTANDSDGIPQLVYYNEKTVDVFNKVWSLIFENEGVHSGSWGSETPAWKNGTALFINAFFGDTPSYRDLEFDFGVLPYPMYDEEQDGYYTHSNVAFTVCAIPMNCDDVERTCAIIEALQSESWRTVIPAYYEVALKVKYSRDDVAAETLDLILDGRYLDFGVIYDQSAGCATLMQQLYSSNNQNFSSAYEKKAKSIQRHYEKLIDKLVELDG